MKIYFGEDSVLLVIICRDDLNSKSAPKCTGYSSELVEGLRTVGSRHRVMNVPETLMKLVLSGNQI